MYLYLKVLNTALGEWIARYLNGKVVGWLVDATGSLQAVQDVDKPLGDQELVDLINQRFDPILRKASLSAVYGDPDFLPISFLQKGINCASAVCRLVRYYGCAYEYIQSNLSQPNSWQDEGLEKLIAALKQVSHNRTTLGLQPYSVNDLAEVLGIEDKLGSEAKNTFFTGFESSPLDALTVEKLRALMPMSYGTGFLVGKNYLLTNHHVLPTANEAKEFLAQFGYEKDLFGRTTLPVEYELDNSFFVTSIKLDYTLVKLRRHPELGDAGEVFGYLRMLEDSKTIAPPLTIDEAEEYDVVDKLSPTVKNRLYRDRYYKENVLKNQPSGLPGEPVNIIQHPKGQPKQIVLSSNRMLEMTHTYLRYEADANFSSSGSPVLNQQWQLVGLHHAALSDSEFNIIGQEGIRICRIVEDLETKRTNLMISEETLKDSLRVIEDLTTRWKTIEQAAQLSSLEGETKQIQELKNEDWLAPVIFDAFRQAISKSKHDGKPVDLEPVRQEGMNWLGIWLKMSNDALEAAEYGELRIPIATSINELEQLLQSEDFGRAQLKISWNKYDIDKFLEGFVKIPDAVPNEYDGSPAQST